ncbi:MAG: DEAD/DEAH box helicase family protein, partial [Chloroflexota bacterium]|nr:DEAD/DEAH box helicase family protein [Chloroflexota bacterium]
MIATAVAADVSAEPFDLDRIEAIAARLDLRQPNAEALESIVFEIARHFEIDREPPPFEAVVDVATGVGKTYVLAAAIEYLAAEGVRDFAVITPGRTILDKTVANFTPGHPKSLLGGMEVRPVVVTSDNFATPAMRAAMDDPEQVKLFIFTVQALLKPESKVGRKTHKFQEGLGEAFYAHLQGLDGLVVFADEHHTYYGPAFSSAVRDLRPRVLIGLTATPHKKTPPDQIIFRYPLSAAIADKLVKTPVLVGRKDDRSDPRTKLLDGVRLLELKDQAIGQWCKETDTAPVTPVMLVIAPSIAEAQEIEGIVTEPTFAGGRYADKVLTVHSSAPDEALAELDRLEEAGSPYRVVVSVGMLKEGWDVKNVYVIASMRASVSDILTEQTLGRGLRLPFGRYTDVEILDTLEVLGHERYEDLLRKAGVLNEQFIDRRTRAILRRNAEGRLVPVSETTTVQARIAPVVSLTPGAAPAGTQQTTGGIAIQSVEDHAAKAQQQLLMLQVELAPRPDLPRLRIPQLKMTAVKSEFSLADITELGPFRRLGESIAADPAGSLRRVAVSARIVAGPDGLRRTELVTTRAVNRVESPASLLPLDDARRQLIDQIIASPVVPARANQQRPAAEIVDAFLRGLGPQAESVLSGYLDRAGARLIQLVTEEQRRFAAKPSYDQVVELTEFDKVRIGRPETSRDCFGPFKRGVGYEGYRKSLYAQDWFDSSTERDVANLLEDEDDIVLWARLQTGDVPILWTGAREYNPDFVAVDRDETHWLIEVKMDKEMGSADVQGKREAARRWANHVSADEKVSVVWRYLLASEFDVTTAKGSWAALKALGG